jgi:hypothetical protein
MAGSLFDRLLEEFSSLVKVAVVFVDHLRGPVAKERYHHRTRKPLGQRLGWVGVPEIVRGDATEIRDLAPASALAWQVSDKRSWPVRCGRLFSGWPRRCAASARGAPRQGHSSGAVQSGSRATSPPSFRATVCHSAYSWLSGLGCEWARANLPPARLGDTRDEVGRVIGISGKTFEKGKAILEAAAADPEVFVDLVERLDAQGAVEPALQLLPDQLVRVVHRR